MSLLSEIEDGRLEASSAVLRRAVPGYDYRTREGHAETDRAVRETLSTRLAETRRALDDASDVLYRAEKRDAVAALDDLDASIESLQRRVKTATPGGGADGLGGASEEALIELVEHDATLLDDVEELRSTADELVDVAREDDPAVLERRVRRIRRTLREVDREFAARTDHLRSIR